MKVFFPYFRRSVDYILYYSRGKEAVRKRRKCKKYHSSENISIQSVIDHNLLELKFVDKDILKYVTNKYLEHRFDYLGSGWVSVSYDAKPLGIEGKVYNSTFQEPQKATSKFHYTNEYRFIFWNRDYKSGYVWGNDYFDKDQVVNLPEGADIKTVWELGRMEWLVQYAIASCLDTKDKNKYILEYRNEVYDFIEHNPVGKGINWILPMDCAIRMINWLISFDIIRKIDTDNILDEDFESTFAQEIYNHGKFIWDYLECDLNFIRRNNGNHFFSNILGLLFAGTYLSRCKEAKKWFKTGVRLYFEECKSQFYEDGTNIECSTMYHKFMTEMLIFGMAIIIGNGKYLYQVNKNKNAVIKAVQFLKDASTEVGDLIQIGDNDSGKLVCVIPYGEWTTGVDVSDRYINLSKYSEVYGEERFFDENLLSIKPISNFFDGLIHGKESSCIEGRLIYALCRGEHIQFLHQELEGGSNNKPNYESFSIPKEFRVVKSHSFLYKDVGYPNCGYYKDFGLFFRKEGNLQFFLYTGGEKKSRRIGHSHNCILHCEILIDGEYISSDAGTYMYPMNKYTEFFRGRKGHFVPDYGIEPRIITGRWSYSGEESCEVFFIGENEIVLRYSFDDIIHYRDILFDKEECRIVDYGMRDFESDNFLPRFFAKGYGKLQHR